ncbi:hypothetical protein BGZ47_001108 [Haplosporangium gracile]|nr:hypothetical protein BGZ47_001108 [Haplosporangium gracile]
MLQEDISQEQVQAFRSVDKGAPPNTVAPVRPDEIFHVETQIDPETQKEFILWEDILQAFDNAVQVRHKTKVVPFLKGSNYITLLPRRIAAVPNTVLDVVVNTSSTNMNCSSPKNMPEEPVSVPRQEDDNTNKKDAVFQAGVAAFTVRRHPVYGLEEAAMDNYSHIDRPASPQFTFVNSSVRRDPVYDPLHSQRLKDLKYCWMIK